MGSFEAPVMVLLQSDSSPSAGAADAQLHTTAPHHNISIYVTAYTVYHQIFSQSTERLAPQRIYSTLSLLQTSLHFHYALVG